MGSERCVLCGIIENVDHIFFGFVIAKCVWRCLQEALGWDSAPNNGNHVAQMVAFGCSDYESKFFLFAIVAWGLWTNRNKMTIELKFPSSPLDVLHKIDVFL